MVTREQTAQALQRLGIDPVAEGYTVEAVQRGANVELEHTADPDLAVQIAIDHLRERPDYYARLAQAEAAPQGGYGWRRNPWVIGGAALAVGVALGVLLTRR